MDKEFSALSNYLNQVTHFPDEELDKLNAISGLRHIKKGGFFLKEGDKPQ